MNKQSTIIIILIILGLVGAYLLISNGQGDSANQSSQADSEVVDDAMEGVDKPGDSMMMETPEGAISYDLTSGTVSYSAQKRFLEKADEEIVGTTTNVAGSGWLDTAAGAFYFMANLDFTDLETGSPKRDGDVAAGFFDDTAIVVAVNVEDEPGLILGEEVVLEIPVLLNINGVERSEIFEVTATVTEGGYTASGETTVLMSDFNINPPSLLNVYTVDDEIALSFAIEGSAVEGMMEKDGDAMMEGDKMEGEDAMMEGDDHSGDAMDGDAMAQ